jgi:hypothetical protein
MRGSPSPVNGAGSFLIEEKVRSLERAGNGQAAVCLLKPCSLGIRGFESHPPHHNIVMLYVPTYLRECLFKDEVFLERCNMVITIKDRVLELQGKSVSLNLW